MYTVKHPITGSKLYVADFDFPSEMDLENAIKSCGALGRGWRLPTLLEWETIASELIKEDKGNFSYSDYLSSEVIDEKYCFHATVDPFPILDDHAFIKKVKQRRSRAAKVRAVKS